MNIFAKSFYCIESFAEEIKNFHDRLQQILRSALSALTECDKFLRDDNEDENESLDVRLCKSHK